jgi:penicillin-binding protein activator
VKRAFLLFALTAVACGPRRAKTIDPDARAKLEGTGLESRDMRAIAAQMTNELLASGAIRQLQEAPRLAVLPVNNRSRFLFDDEILNTLLTDEIVQAANGRVRVLNRDLTALVIAEREAKRAGQVSGGENKAMLGADYFLEGEIRALSQSSGKHQADYVVVRFQLTDAESTEMVWSNSYEVKKQGTWSVVYQ